MVLPGDAYTDAAFLARWARSSRGFRGLLRVLPISCTATFVVTLVLCYHAYEDASTDPARPLQTISTYQAGPSRGPRHAVPCNDYCASTGCGWTEQWACPWSSEPGLSGYAGDDDSTGFACCCVQRTKASGPCGDDNRSGWPRNLITFRCGIGLVAVQALLIVTPRMALLLQAATAARARLDRPRRAPRVVFRASALVLYMGIASLCGVAAVTYYDDGPLHYTFAAGAFTLLPLGQFIETLGLLCFVLRPRGYDRVGGAVVCWGVVVPWSVPICLSTHLAIDHPPLQWAGAILALAYYWPDTCGFTNSLVAYTLSTHEHMSNKVAIACNVVDAYRGGHLGA